jgi:hypothetical protein
MSICTQQNFNYDENSREVWEKGF